VGLYVVGSQSAHDLAINAPAVTFTYAITLVPTAAAAGPGWNSSTAFTTSPRSSARFFPGAWSLDASRTQISAATRHFLASAAILGIRDLVFPGVGARLAKHRLNSGPRHYISRIDLSFGVRQSCAGVPSLSLAQLNSGASESAGVEVWVASTHTRGRLRPTCSRRTESMRTGGSYVRLMRLVPGNLRSSVHWAYLKTNLYAARLRWLPKKYC
jgi:hypothetical protein